MKDVHLTPGRHGGDGPRLAQRLGVGVDEVLDLSLSLNPVAPRVEALLVRHSDEAARYPSPAPATAALADALGVDRERLLLTNGGSEAIALVASEMSVGWVEEPDFSLYARHLDRVDPAGPRWRSNPHNPSGRLAAPEETAGVWDEAFFPLATGRWSRGDAGAVVVGSLTKLFACPGLRAGYVLAPDADLVKRLAARQPEWSVNGLAAALVPDMLATADLPGWSAAIQSLRGALVDALLGAGLVPEPSDANYVLVPEASGVRDHLARRAIAVRDCASFGVEDGVRIAVPDDAGRERLRMALEER